MWIKKVDGTYYNTATNAFFNIQSSGGAYGIFVNNTGSAVANQFASVSEAQEALDQFMSEVGHEEIPSGELN